MKQDVIDCLVQVADIGLKALRMFTASTAIPCHRSMKFTSSSNLGLAGASTGACFQHRPCPGNEIVA